MISVVAVAGFAPAMRMRLGLCWFGAVLIAFGIAAFLMQIYVSIRRRHELRDRRRDRDRDARRHARGARLRRDAPDHRRHGGPVRASETGQLPRALPLDDPERSRNYAAGDLSYWSPSRKIAVVYDVLGRSVPPPGLVRLGTVQTGLQGIASAGNDFTMTIRRGHP